MIERVPLSLLYPQARLALDYVAADPAVASLFSHAPHGFAAAAKARGEIDYPREAICEALAAYNRRLGASAEAIRNIERLRDRSALCVVSGQQAGFLGGPVFTAYKILTTIRLARDLTDRLARPIVPCFWLATEDHDFTEINHIHVLKADGEVGRVAFDWDGRGRPIADLPVTDAVRTATAATLAALAGGPFRDLVARAIVPHDGEDYCTWHARLWSERFAASGIVLIEPPLLRAPGRDLLRTLFEHRAGICADLEAVAGRLRDAGYEPALDPERAGLYTFDEAGHRVRVAGRSVRPSDIAAQPERFSPDAGLRPLLADAVLPIVASVLGPGEIAYHAMLRPLYDRFELPQPVVVPREGYTLVARAEADLLARLSSSAREMLAERFDPGEMLGRLLPASLARGFASAQGAFEKELAALHEALSAIDPGLEAARQAAVGGAAGAIERLKARTVRALAARQGISAGGLQRVRNALLPRGRPQERVFPLIHFVNRYGSGFLPALLAAGGVAPGFHGIIVPEEGDG